MNPVFFKWSNGSSESIFQGFETLLFVSLIGGLLVLLMALVHRILRKWLSPGILYLLWMLVIFRFVLIAAPESPTSVLNLFESRVLEQQPIAQTSNLTLPEGFWNNESAVVSQSMVSGENPTNSQVDSISSFDIWNIVGVVWFVGMLFFAIRLLVGYLHIRRLIACSYEPPQHVLHQFRNLQQRIPTRQHVTIHLTNELNLPAMVGFIRPKILIPAWSVEELESRQLDLILAHELIHIRRFDGLFKILAHFVAILHWFNPMVRVACRFVESCRELACDQRVVELMNVINNEQTERLYGKTLLDIAVRSNEKVEINSVFLGGFLGNNQNLVRERIAMLVEKNVSQRGSRILGVACILLMLAVGYTAAQTATSSPSQSSSSIDAKPQEGEEAIQAKPSFAARQVVASESAHEISTHQHCSVPFMQGDKELISQFKLADDRICQLKCSDGQIVVVGIKPGATNMQFTDDQGVVTDYQVRVLPSRPVRLTQGATTRLTFDEQIPELLVENPDVIKASPVSPTEILVTGVGLGRSTLTVSNPDRELTDKMIEVVPDTRGMAETLAKAFPSCSIQVDTSGSTVILTGHAELGKASQIKELAETLSDAVVVCQVTESKLTAIKVEIFEIETDKLRAIDFSHITDGDVSSISDLFTDSRIANSEETITLDVSSSDSALLATIRDLQKNKVVTLLDQPTLVATNDQPADFLSGGEIPIEVQNEDGTKSIEFRPFGTILQIRPAFNETDQMTLELRLELSELDQDLSTVEGVPGFRIRRINTGAQLKPGQIVAIVGDYQRSNLSGESDSEKETLILITPRLLDE